MKFKPVFHLIAYLLIFTGIAILLSAAVGWAMGDSLADVRALLLGAAAGVISGILLALLMRGDVVLSRRDGFGVVAFGWLAVALVGMLPYLFSGVIRDLASALFETVSGFTTTGASVLTNLEEIPAGILFWRSMTQWLGGMGVLVLCVAILPFLGVGGMQIYQAEIPGPSKDRLTPRIATTAKLLWGLYLLITVAQVILLMLGGMSAFDATCHAFTTMSTGGFSTRTASVAAYDSAYIDWVIIIFMYLAGANFALHFKALRGEARVFLKDSEFRYYTILWFVGCLLISINFGWSRSGDSIIDMIRHGFFQGTSIMTTTGYATRDFNLWPLFARCILLWMMFCGGCGGSTAGGIKVVRVVVVFKHVVRELKRVMVPQTVAHVKLGKRPIEEGVVANILNYFVLFMLIFAVMTLLMTFYTPDLVTATSAVVACLGNIGPGLGAVGPTETYAFIEPTGKLLLTLCMLLGRLELFTVVLLFFPSFWRK